MQRNQEAFDQAFPYIETDDQDLLDPGNQEGHGVFKPYADRPWLERRGFREDRSCFGEQPCKLSQRSHKQAKRRTENDVTGLFPVTV